jgi:hypothetical protein
MCGRISSVTATSAASAMGGRQFNSPELGPEAQGVREAPRLPQALTQMAFAVSHPAYRARSPNQLASGPEQAIMAGKRIVYSQLARPPWLRRAFLAGRREHPSTEMDGTNTRRGSLRPDSTCEPNAPARPVPRDSRGEPPDGPAAASLAAGLFLGVPSMIDSLEVEVLYPA